MSSGRAPTPTADRVKFQIDENLPEDLAEELWVRGHEADTVVSEGLKGAADPVILQRVQTEQRVLQTLDKGIADVRVYPPAQYSGLVLLRPPSTGRHTVIAFVQRHLDTLLEQTFEGRLLVVSEGSIRIR